MDPVTLAQQLIRCPSVTPEEAGALNLLQQQLEAVGFTCHRIRFEEKDTPTVDNLFARIGAGAPHFCFAGHMDVVPPGHEDAWTYPPFAAQIHDGMLYGRGAEDMKSAIAAFMAAAAAFLKAGKEWKGTLSLLITCDEEGPAINGTKKMLGWLKEKGERLDVCLVGEPTNPDRLGQMMKVGRRGSMNSLLTVHGKQGHVAYPHLADNPVTVLLNILQQLKQTEWDKGTEFFQPTNLEITSIDVGNPAVNVIPAKAAARFNIRFNDLHRSKELEAKIRAVCSAQHMPYDLQVKVTGEAFLSPPGEFAKLISTVIKEITGLKPELSTSGGTSDARFIKDVCPVVEFGATGRTSHMVDEHIAVEDVRTLAQIYEKILMRFFASK